MPDGVCLPYPIPCFLPLEFMLWLKQTAHNEGTLVAILESRGGKSMIVQSYPCFFGGGGGMTCREGQGPQRARSKAKPGTVGHTESGDAHRPSFSPQVERTRRQHGIQRSAASNVWGWKSPDNNNTYDRLTWY